MSEVFQQGEIVRVNKWSPSFYPFEVYDPANRIFPKQHRLFGEFVFVGIVLEVMPEFCEVWVANLQTTHFIFHKDIAKCQD